MKGDAVFFLCSNPGTGVITSISKDKKTATVHWNNERKARRVDIKNIKLLCQVLNGYLVKANLISDSKFLYKDYP